MPYAEYWGLLTGCILTVIVGYWLAGQAVLSTANPSAILEWAYNYRVDRPPIWGTSGIGRLPSTLKAALGSLVPIPSQWTITSTFAFTIAVACELVVLIPIVFLFHTTKLKSQNTASSNGWPIVVAYFSFWPFIVWWDPYEPKWFVVPNLLAAALIAMAWARLLRNYPRSTVILSASVLTIAFLNFSSTIWPRHSQLNAALINARCIANNLHEGDLFLDTDWQLVDYLPYFFDRDVPERHFGGNSFAHS